MNLLKNFENFSVPEERWWSFEPLGIRAKLDENFRLSQSV
jgi:hypothetical protein